MRNRWSGKDKSRKCNIDVLSIFYYSQYLSSSGCIWNKTMTHLISFFIFYFLFISHTNHRYPSFPSFPFPSLPMPTLIHSTERVRHPMESQQAWHIQFRQDQASPSPASRLSKASHKRKWTSKIQLMAHNNVISSS